MKNLLIWLLMIFPFLVSAQENTEVVDLRTDQDTYLTGEYIWFSALVTDGKQKASDLSKVLYVEVLDRENSPLLQAKVMLEEGRGNGSLFIPASLESDMYTLRAYTRWMQNQAPDYYFHKPLRILNPFVPLSTTDVAEKQIKATILPEGGTWTKGIPAVLAFRVTGSDGTGIPFRGILLGKEDTLARFTPEKFGRGHVAVTPQYGQAYEAVILDVYDSILLRVPLPEVEESGPVIRAERQLTGYDVRLNCQGCRPGQYRFYLNDSLLNIRADGTEQKLTLNWQDLQTGMNFLVIISENGNVAAERALFKFPENSKATISLTSSRVTTRESLEYAVQAPPGAHLTLRVYREDALNTARNRSVAASVYLRPWVGSSLEDPDYFFSENPGAAGILEEVLRLARRPAPYERNFLPEFRGQLITARLQHTDRPPGNIPVYLSLPGKPFVFRTGITDSTGIVHFQAGSVRGNRPLIIQPARMEDSTLGFDIEPIFSQAYAQVALPPLEIGPDVSKALEQRSLGMQMDNIYHGKARSERVLPAADTLPFYGTPTHRYRLDDYTRFPTMLDVLKEYVYTVSVRRRNKSYVLRVYDEENNVYYEDLSLTLLDGVPVTDHDKIIEFDPLKVEKIEVIAGRYVYGPMAFPGIVSFTTYKRNMEGFDFPTSLLQGEFEGAQPERVFFSPDHSSTGGTRKPDMRSLLHWDPELSIPENGESRGSFRTSDLPGTYRVVVEGLDASGTPVYGETRFTVTAEVRSKR